MGDQEQRARLEAAVAANAGAPEFPALVELYRRAGRLADAERVGLAGLARSPDNHVGHVMLALALLEQGRDLDARAVLEPLAQATLARLGIATGERAEATTGELSDSELDDAFAHAETDRDELIDPDRVAEEAVERADVGAESLVENGLDGEIAPGAAFATRTMADLLERQGDIEGAARIRAALGAAAPAPRPSGRLRVVAELERWLGNLQNHRGVRT